MQAVKRATVKKASSSSRNWTDIDLVRSVDAVRNGQLSRHGVAHVYAVPRRTLQRYLSGQRTGTTASKKLTLSEDEDENDIVEGLLDWAPRGFLATRWRLKLMVLDVISDGKQHQISRGGPSDKWVSRFLDRHSGKLSTRKGRIWDSARVNAVKKHDIEYFIAEFVAFQEEYALSPSRIYNCDDTGVDPQGTTPKRVIAPRGARNVSVRRGDNRENTSALLAISASGSFIPPLFIFKGQALPSDFLIGSSPGSIATVSDNAFVDSEVFELWLGFIDHIPAARAVLLDNHVSHVCLEVRRKCVLNGIRLLSFPPHTTHTLQPLDAGCFRTFKSI